MSVERVEVESVHGDVTGQRLVFYRYVDAAGEVRSYGPIITSDSQFDAEAYCAVIRDKLNRDTP